MICPNCGSEIPSGFRFCGMCGERLRFAEVPANGGAEQEAFSSLRGPSIAPSAQPEHPLQPEYAYPDEARAQGSAGGLPPEEHSGSHEPGISGPSFLGLSQAGNDSGGSYGYLLEDEPRRSHAGAVLLLVVLVILGAVAWRRWGAIESYVANLRKPPATVYPNTADHSDTGLTSNMKPPEHAPVPPDQQVATNAPSNADQPQMTIEEQSKPPTIDDKKKAAAPNDSTRASSASASPPGAPAESSPQQPAPSDASPSAEEKHSAPAPKPAARARAVIEKPKEEPGARTLALGEKYLYGRGVPRNCDQALIYLKAAANAGNPAARSHLGALYSTGECVARDRVAAYHWFALASRAEPANPWLESSLNTLWRDMSPDERRRVGTER